MDRLFERGALILGVGKKQRRADIVRGTYRGKDAGKLLSKAADEQKSRSPGQSNRTKVEVSPMPITTNDLHGPTQLDLNPKPPNAVRLSKRAGFLGLAILGLVGILVFFGIATRSDRQFKLGFHPDEARNVTAATDVGKSIASKVSARPAGEVREQAKPEQSDDLTAPPLTYRPAKVQPSVVTQGTAPIPASPQYARHPHPHNRLPKTGVVTWQCSANRKRWMRPPRPAKAAFGERAGAPLPCRMVRTIFRR